MKKSLFVALSLIVCLMGQACSSSVEDQKTDNIVEIKRLLDELVKTSAIEAKKADFIKALLDEKKSAPENDPRRPQGIRFKAPSPMPY